MLRDHLVEIFDVIDENLNLILTEQRVVSLFGKSRSVSVIPSTALRITEHSLRKSVSNETVTRVWNYHSVMIFSILNSNHTTTLSTLILLLWRTSVLGVLQ
ncbi:MAG: hypothetical protein ACJATI_000600 [Halioglobus sp.]|jgi:hypothetical protein